MIKYKRVLLKLSGESLMGNGEYGIDSKILEQYANDIKEIVALGVQVGIVIGGGNIFRGLSGVDKGFDRVKGDQMGMLATIINSLGIHTALENAGIIAKTFTSIRMEPVGELFSKHKVVEALNKGKVVILGGGTGNPYFTTDTASALRAIEIEADVLLKGTRVDGVYTADPEKDPKAVKYETLTFDEAYSKNLKVMDLTSFTMCKENKMPVIVFDMNKKGNLKKVISGEKTGTLVTP